MESRMLQTPDQVMDILYLIYALRVNDSMGHNRHNNSYLVICTICHTGRSWIVVSSTAAHD